MQESLESQVDIKPALQDDLTHDDVVLSLNTLASNKATLSLVVVTTAVLPVFYNSVIGAARQDDLFAISLVFTCISAGLLLCELIMHFALPDLWAWSLLQLLSLSFPTLPSRRAATFADLVDVIRRKLKINLTEDAIRTLAALIPVGLFVIGYYLQCSVVNSTSSAATTDTWWQVGNCYLASHFFALVCVHGLYIRTLVSLNNSMAEVLPELLIEKKQ